MTTEMYKVEDFLEHVKKSKSKQTLNLYKYGIKKFSEWSNKTPNEILEERRQNWISGDLMTKKTYKSRLEEFHKWLIEHDYAKIKKDMLPDLNQDAPISFELITEKEKVLSKTFPSQETVDLLKEYLPTLSAENPYLFQSNGDGYFSEESINRNLRDLADKAQIKIPKNKKLRFHCFRKRFLTECANLNIDVNTAKILCGKDVEESMLAYLSEVEHREAFIKVHERLRLTETPMRKTTMATSEIEKRLELLERKINLMSALDPNIERKADKILSDMGIIMGIDMTVNEKLDVIIQKQKEKEQAEYKRIIEENNGNNNH